MNTILTAIFLVAFLAFWIWALWLPISCLYHAIMMTVFAVAWLAIAIYEGVVAASEVIFAYFRNNLNARKAFKTQSPSEPASPASSEQKRAAAGKRPLR